VEKLPCVTRVTDVWDGHNPVRLDPLRHFPIVSDLVVDVAGFFQRMSAADMAMICEAEAFLPFTVDTFAVVGLDPKLVELTENFSRFSRFEKCIECGICMSACPTMAADEKFLGPAGLATIHQARKKTNDPLKVEHLLGLADGEHGVWRCHSAFECTEHFNAKLTVLHVIEGLHSLGHRMGETLPEDEFQKLQVAGQKLSEIVEDIKKEHPAVEATEGVGSVCSHIVELAKLLKSDLIVVSTHNYPWFKRLMSGSDAEKIARHAPCPILIVHQREHDFVD